MSMGRAEFVVMTRVMGQVIRKGQTSLSKMDLVAPH